MSDGRAKQCSRRSLKLSSLVALGFILFVISFIVLATSRYMLRPRLGK